ncbi:SET domain-containing protein-lysine N-methyltransferase [Rubripirellula sp.]|nr:SET domain-containing protein-lysine N-methyltransferase [Rubripirellula sp.]
MRTRLRKSWESDTVLDPKRRKKLQKRLDAEHGYRAYCDHDVEVGTNQCGHGVYAVRQFLPGEIVLEVEGQFIRHKTYPGSNYLMELTKKWSLEPSIPAVFINHSCSPNTELVQLSDFEMLIVAICNIEPGTEITFDYGWIAHEWTPKCKCGAPNCRGWVCNADEVKKAKKLTSKNKKNR